MSKTRSSFVEIAVNPLGTGIIDNNHKLELVNNSIPIPSENFQELLENVQRNIDSPDLLKIISTYKNGYYFTSIELIQLLDCIVSKKIQINIIEMIGPRLTDPKKYSNEIINRFRYAEEREVVQDVLKTRAQTLNSSTYGISKQQSKKILIGKTGLKQKSTETMNSSHNIHHSNLPHILEISENVNHDQIISESTTSEKLGSNSIDIKIENIQDNNSNNNNNNNNDNDFINEEINCIQNVTQNHQNNETITLDLSQLPSISPIILETPSRDLITNITSKKDPINYLENSHETNNSFSMKYNEIQVIQQKIEILEVENEDVLREDEQENDKESIKQEEVLLSSSKNLILNISSTIEKKSSSSIPIESEHNEKDESKKFYFGAPIVEIIGNKTFTKKTVNKVNRDESIITQTDEFSFDQRLPERERDWSLDNSTTTTTTTTTGSQVSQSHNSNSRNEGIFQKLPFVRK